MKRLFCLIFIILFAFPLVACSNNNKNNSDGDGTTMKLTVVNEVFEVELMESATTEALCSHLPLEITMQELNNNEKYFYLDFQLPTDKFSPVTITAGDVMLYQDNCLVIFYESFNSPFFYTKIGKIKNTEKLKDTVGKGSIKVLWSL